jgi:hypothetical protein
MPLTQHQKAYRFARTIQKVKTEEEKRERAHVVVDYCVALLAEGHKKTKLPRRVK